MLIYEAGHVLRSERILQLGLFMRFIRLLFCWAYMLRARLLFRLPCLHPAGL